MIIVSLQLLYLFVSLNKSVNTITAFRSFDIAFHFHQNDSKATFATGCCVIKVYEL